jgi:hypothetical protein
MVIRRAVSRRAFAEAARAGRQISPIKYKQIIADFACKPLRKSASQSV